MGYLGITFALELMLRFQPLTPHHKPLFKLPLLVFERIEFLQILRVALLNAVIVISPHFQSTAFVANRDDQTTASWTVYPKSLSEREKLDMIYSVAEMSFESNLKVLEK